MRALILGGTRFIGRALGRALIAGGHEVVVSSQRPEGRPLGAKAVPGERTNGLKALSGAHFDAVIDFTAYTPEAPAEATRAVRYERYVLISSTWVTRLRPGINAGDPVAVESVARPVNMRPDTFDYLSAKAGAEGTVAFLAAGGLNAVTLRLPIVLGAEDHTGRLAFYRRRFDDEHPLILVDGGFNRAQVVWSEDVAAAITAWLEEPVDAVQGIVEALADDGQSVHDLVTGLAESVGLRANVLEVSAAELEISLPDFLHEEPLWRESPLQQTELNLFRLANRLPTSAATWLKALAQDTPSGKPGPLREREIAFLESRRDGKCFSHA